jgi:hypothetical protein
VSRCVCNGLGAYLDAGDGDVLLVEACAEHPLEFGADETAASAAAARVDACLDAIATVRDILWPEDGTRAAWSRETVLSIAAALAILRAPGLERARPVPDARPQ